MSAFEIVRDSRGSLVHVRSGHGGECVGCIESGLYEVLRMLILDEQRQLIGPAVEVEGERDPWVVGACLPPSRANDSSVTGAE